MAKAKPYDDSATDGIPEPDADDMPMTGGVPDGHAQAAQRNAVPDGHARAAQRNADTMDAMQQNFRQAVNSTV